MIQTISFGKGNEYPELTSFLEANYPIPNTLVRVRINNLVSHFDSGGSKITGHVSVMDSISAKVDVAAKGRFKREVALTIAHEYKHCIQFITEDRYLSAANEKVLEQEAKEFAEEVLTRLWNEQQIHYPSTM